MSAPGRIHGRARAPRATVADAAGPRHRIPCVLAALSAAAFTSATPLPGQSGSPVAVAAIQPDSVRVGEPFTVGITVVRPTPGEVRFPALLQLPDALEQRGAVQIRASADDTEWRAYYPLVAWRAEAPAIPRIEVELEAAGATRSLTVSPPALVVRSVLPAEVADLELREAKPFLRLRGFPWWILALLVGLAALAWWWWRRRAPALAASGALGPGALALAEFERLRGAWSRGDVRGDRFYDGYESVLRDYARATRGWSPSRGLFGLAGGHAGLLEALRRSLLVRFARLREADDGPPTALDAGEDFVRSELAPADLGPDDGDGEEVEA